MIYSYLTGNPLNSNTYGFCYSRRSCAQVTRPSFALDPYCYCER